jgi:MFS family permease
MLSGIAFVLFINHLGWDDTTYTQFAGGPALVSGAAGSALGGYLADKIGRKKLAALGSGAMASLWLAFALVHAWWHYDSLQYALLVIEPFTQGAMTAALFTLCMDTSLPRTAATQYVTYTSLMNLGTTLGAKALSHRALVWWDYRGIYLAAGLVQLVGLAILPFIDAREARRQLDV